MTIQQILNNYKPKMILIINLNIMEIFVDEELYIVHNKTIKYNLNIDK